MHFNSERKIKTKKRETSLDFGPLEHNRPGKLLSRFHRGGGQRRIQKYRAVSDAHAMARVPGSAHTAAAADESILFARSNPKIIEI